MTTAQRFPVRASARLDPELSRWLWLVKWILAIPHYLALGFLWIAFLVLTVVAFFAILITGRYPRALFDFNVGVLRWSWRVHFYTYAALGTDRYPPFTLADVPDYPARLEVDYPPRLSRGLVLVKWWLLAIPHYIVVGVFAGGGLWFLWWPDADDTPWAGGGLIGILVLVAGIVLLFTGRYPGSVFDFVLGLNRWVIRVAGYAALMTDRYPPFRFDMGGTDPDAADDAADTAPDTGPEPAPPPVTHGWTGGRVVSVIAGAVLALASVGMLSLGGTLLWADRAERDAAGFLSLSDDASTGTYALATRPVELAGTPADLALLASGLGEVRVRVEDTRGGEVFVGIARDEAVTRYLSTVGHAIVDDPDDRSLTVHSGGAPEGSPATEEFWVVQSTGTGQQTVAMPDVAGDWTVVAMNADGSRGVDVRAQLSATVPALPWVAGGLIVVGLLFLAGGVVLIAIPVSRASRTREPPLSTGASA